MTAWSSNFPKANREKTRAPRLRPRRPVNGCAGGGGARHSNTGMDGYHRCYLVRLIRIELWGTLKVMN